MGSPTKELSLQAYKIQFKDDLEIIISKFSKTITVDKIKKVKKKTLFLHLMMVVIQQCTFGRTGKTKL